MGLIEVKTYTSAAEMMAAHAATRKRLLSGQSGKPVAVSPPPDLDFIDLEYLEPDPVRVELQHDAHVNTRACYLLKEMGNRVMALPIIRAMCKEYGYTYADIRSDHRRRPICFVRQKMMWVIRQRTQFSYPEIGRKFGGRDHATVIHAVNKIEALIAANDPSVEDLKGWLE